MIKERLQEIVDFTQSESPYRKANKGWINQDIYLDLGKSSNNRQNEKEFANVTLLWSPIYQLITNIILVVFIASILVIGSITLSKDNFSLALFDTLSQVDIVKVGQEKIVLTSENDYLLEDNSTSRVNEELDKEKTDLSKVNSSLTDLSVEVEDKNGKDINNNENPKVLKTSKSKSNFV